MALRVLLADESPTIKKVIQLALQDYSVEVKAVPVGIDVIPIAKVFQPDIILVDVLLVKKSGYEVARDIKKDPELGKIPVVLLWNSLMGIDEAKAKDSNANKRLEKPFEVETLRAIVQELSPKTVNHPISSFLNFDEIDSIKEYRKDQKDETNQRQSIIPPKIPNFNIPAQSSDYVIEDSILPDELQLTEDSEEFAQVPLHKSIPLNAPSIDDRTELEGPEEWQAEQVNAISPKPPEKSFPPKQNLSNLIEEEDLMKAKRKITDSFEEIIFTDSEIEGAELDSKSNQPGFTAGPAGSQKSEFTVPALSNIPLDAKTQEKIFREEVRVIAEKICWSLLPDITERVVREEIKKLLQEP